MHAKPERVKPRRTLRRVKATISIGVALAAGLFLACQRAVQTTTQANDAGSGAPDRPDAPPPTDRDATLTPTVSATTSASEDSGPDATTDATATGATGGDAGERDGGAGLVRHDGGARRPAVDRREHRKGMPVPDNLLE